MTLQDANKLLSIAKANYSNAFKTMSQQEKVLLVKSWAFALQDIPADIVMIAFMQLLSVSKWLPTVAEIREQVRKMYYEAESSEQTMYLIDSGSQSGQRKRAARRYIMQAAGHLRGEASPAISLDAILGGPLGLAIGSGDMELDRISGDICAAPEEKSVRNA